MSVVYVSSPATSTLNIAIRDRHDIHELAESDLP
jgi:hypothetical protein